MKTLKYYHDLYLKCDVLLLADVFEKFKNNSLKNYLSAPGLSLDAMLRITKIIITDPDMYMFFEKGTRGGIFYISNRYNKANYKYLKSFDPKQGSKHIIHLDANNLHGYAMSKFPPTSGFKWIDPKEVDLNKYTNNSWNDYLLAPDKIEIKREILSEYQLEIADLYNIPIGNIKKLVPILFHEEKYVIHYENLKLCLRLGLKLKKYMAY